MITSVFISDWVSNRPTGYKSTEFKLFNTKLQYFFGNCYDRKRIFVACHEEGGDVEISIQKWSCICTDISVSYPQLCKIVMEYNYAADSIYECNKNQQFKHTEFSVHLWKE